MRRFMVSTKTPHVTNNDDIADTVLVFQQNQKAVDEVLNQALGGQGNRQTHQPGPG